MLRKRCTLWSRQMHMKSIENILCYGCEFYEATGGKVKCLSIFWQFICIALCTLKILAFHWLTARESFIVSMLKLAQWVLLAKRAQWSGCYQVSDTSAHHDQILTTGRKKNVNNVCKHTGNDPEIYCIFFPFGVWLQHRVFASDCLCIEYMYRLMYRLMYSVQSAI